MLPRLSLTLLHSFLTAIILISALLANALLFRKFYFRFPHYWQRLSCLFIADIAANHDGDLSRAKQLITLAKESGADAVKFHITTYLSTLALLGLHHLVKI